MRSWTRSLSLFLALLLTAGACGDDEEASTGTTEGGAGGGTEGGGASGEEYVLGFSSDLSGAFAGLSRPILAGTRAYFECVNADGGIDGHPVRLEVRDDRLDVQTGQANIRELAEMGVPVILGNVSSVVWATTAPMAEELEVAQIAGGAVDSFVYPPQPYLYRYLQSAVMAADGMTDFAMQTLGDEEPRLAVIRYDSAGTDAWAEAIEENLSDLGTELTVEEQRFPADATDLSPAAAAVAGSNPNLVLSVLTDTQAPLAVEALRNRGYEGPIVNWVGISESTLAAVGDPEFYVIRDTVPPVHPEAARMQECGEVAGVAGDMEHDFTTNGWLAAQATHEALLECGYPCSGPEFNEAILRVGEMETEGLSGPGWGVSEDTHIFSDTVSIWHLEDGADLSTMVGDWFVPGGEGGGEG